MRRLRIHIDPKIKELYGPEVSWVWRLLLTGIGLSWEEVSLGNSECDIAYLTDMGSPSRARIRVRANLDRWRQKSRFRLRRLGIFGDLLYPDFEDGLDESPVFFSNEDTLTCTRDLVFDIFWLVTGQEESYWRKDKRGFFDLSQTLCFGQNISRLAISSGIGSWLGEKIFQRVGVVPILRWPKRKRAAACLSHDVEYPEIRRFVEPIRIVGRQGIAGLRSAVHVLKGAKDHWNFPKWVQMENTYGVKAAFFFAAHPGSLLKYACGTPDPFYDIGSERFRELFQYLTDEGFEIGFHASFHACESQKKLETERKILQRVSGRPVHGNRHHRWHLSEQDVEDTLLLHERVGLTYDTSLTHERYIGWRRGTSWPFFPFHKKKRQEVKTLQISTTWMDDHLFGHLEHNPGDRFETLKTLVATAANQGGCLLTDMHDYVFDEMLFPGWVETYRWLLEHLIRRSDFWIATPGEVADHWISRYDTIVRESIGLKEGFYGEDDRLCSRSSKSPSVEENRPEATLGNPPRS